MTIFFRKISFYLALAGIIAAASLIVRLRASIGEPITPPPVTPPTKPFAHGIGASGIVEARQENTLLGVPQPGLLTKINVAVWDRVEAGAPLLQLDDRDLRANLLTQQAQVRIAEATLQRVRDQLVRLKSVDDPRAVSVDEIKNRENDVAVAEAQLDGARAAIAQTQALLDRLTIRAPVAGTILQVNVRVGEYISPATGIAPIVLGNIDEVQVRADVDEQIAPRVKAGKRAVGYLKGDTRDPIAMEFVRIEPFVIPKKSLTGGSIERVDTRVLQVIYRFPTDSRRPVYVGQQLDLFIEE
jgi:RND family efflux transporter MFP subunit